MPDMDFGSSERLMYQRVNEELHQAELRRLRRKAGAARPGRLLQQPRWALGQLGRLLVQVGQRLQRTGQAPTLSTQELA